MPNGHSDGERITALEVDMRGITSDVKEIRDDVRVLRSQLAGRPTWAVTMIITLLTAACTGLGAAVIALVRGGG